MAILQTTILVAGLIFVCGMVYKAYRHHQRVTAWSRKSDEEWAAIQELAQDPNRVGKAMKRFEAQVGRKPPPP
jgi:hypothetical protein